MINAPHYGQLPGETFEKHSRRKRNATEAEHQSKRSSFPPQDVRIRSCCAKVEAIKPRL
jgi:hypothetical protein